MILVDGHHRSDEVLPMPTSDECSRKETSELLDSLIDSVLVFLKHLVCLSIFETFFFTWKIF